MDSNLSLGADDQYTIFGQLLRRRLEAALRPVSSLIREETGSRAMPTVVPDSCQGPRLSAYMPRWPSKAGFQPPRNAAKEMRNNTLVGVPLQLGTGG